MVANNCNKIPKFSVCWVYDCRDVEIVLGISFPSSGGVVVFCGFRHAFGVFQGLGHAEGFEGHLDGALPVCFFRYAVEVAEHLHGRADVVAGRGDAEAELGHQGVGDLHVGIAGEKLCLASANRSVDISVSSCITSNDLLAWLFFSNEKKSCRYDIDGTLLYLMK